MTIQTRTIHAALAETPDIEALAARAVALGRELAAAAHACYAGGGSTDAGFVERCLRRLGERVAFDGRDFAGIAEARALIAKDLEGEVVGTERRVVGHDYDLDGDRHDVLAEVPCHTERGERLREVLALMDEFVRTRDAVLDRAAAHRALFRLMSG